jgi:hypothetical protein
MARPTKPPHEDLADTITSESQSLSSTPTLQYLPCTLRLDQVDAQSLRHIYCHRDGPSMAWNDDKDAAPDNLKSLGESLLSEGQIVPIEFYTGISQMRAVRLDGPPPPVDPKTHWT